MQPTGVALSVKVDWAGNGFSTGAYDDITPLVIDGTISRSGGTAVLTVSNTDNRFFVGNTGSVLYPYVKPGCRCRIVVTYSGTTYPLFAGYLRSIVPSVSTSGARVAALKMEDHLSFRKNNLSLPAIETQSVGAFRRDVLDAMGLTTALRNLTYCPEDEMCDYTSVSDKPGSVVLEEINEGTLTRHFMRAGASETNWVQYVARDRQYDLSGAVDDTWTDSDFESLDGLDYNYDSIVNEQSVEAEPMVLQDSQVVWESPGMPYTIAASGTKTLWAKLSDFVWPAGYLSRTSRKSRLPVSPALGCVMVKSGTVTAVVTGYGESAKVVLSGGASGGVVTYLSLYGQVALAVDSLVIKTTDTASQTAYGVRAGASLSSRFIVSSTQADGVADHIVWRLKDPLSIPTITMRNRFPRCFNRELYEHVAVTSAKAYMTAKRHAIIGIDWSFSKDGDWTTTYALLEAPEQSPAAWFTWGTVMGVSSSPRLGY